MKIAIIQMQVKLEKTEQNIKKALNFIDKAVKKNVDVVVLPEMFMTGFFPENVAKFSDENGEKIKQIFSNLAKKHQIYMVLGSFINRKNSAFYNTNFVFDKNGELINSYDKIHLFSPSGENKFFANGDKISFFDINGIKASCFICYDLRFPKIFNYAAKNGAKVVFLAAQWGFERVKHLEILLKARAIENQIFIAACCACGKNKFGKLSGNSSVISPNGDEILHLGDKEQNAYCKISLSKIDKIRQKMYILGDEKEFLGV